MPKILAFEDIETRLDEVKRAMRETNDKRLYERYLCICLLLSGYSRKNITEILDRGLDTIGNYIQDYCTSGLEGLNMEHSPGRPALLTLEQEQVLYRTLVEKKPVDVGFPAKMNWTSGIVRKWIKNEFQVEYSERGTRELLYRLGFAHTRPTYTMAKANPEQQEVFKQEFEVVKKITKPRN
ncbi:putative transposase [Paenibacillus sp. GP183]|nr:putative transposase [Paenibacillus sp. GP183]